MYESLKFLYGGDPTFLFAQGLHNCRTGPGAIYSNMDMATYLCLQYIFDCDKHA